MSTTSTTAGPSNDVWNVPNQITLLRLLLSVVLFVLLQFNLFMVGLIVFSVAAGTDWIDGHYARKYGQVTKLGRVLDPFVDKIIICGTFIYLAAIPHSAVTAWMAVVVVGRELLVTALRSFLEGEGADFSAAMSGKLKMVLQCAAVITSLLALTYADPTSRPQWLQTTLHTTVWAAVALTLISGAQYVRRGFMLATNKS
jgi:CDP-diacylglycerol--glycerol-3-phosphate 3-phosphatidyltransferase